MPVKIGSSNYPIEGRTVSSNEVEVILHFGRTEHLSCPYPSVRGLVSKLDDLLQALLDLAVSDRLGGFVYLEIPIYHGRGLTRPLIDGVETRKGEELLQRLRPEVALMVENCVPVRL